MTLPVISTLDDGLRRITLNRPEALNAMNGELIAAVAAAFAAANRDPATGVILFTGAGRAFCAGDDLKDHHHPETEAEARAYIETIQQVSREIVLGDKLVIGAINGWAVGGGFEWAINCDFSLWAESARAFFPEVKWGWFVTGGVTALLPARVGLTKAMEMLVLGERYSARDLHDCGLAWKVVPDADLPAEAEALARRILALPPRAVADMKRVLLRAALGTADSLEQALTLETEATVRGFLDPETTARVKAFIEKE